MAKLWGGRFSEKYIDPAVMDFTSSLEVDKVLAKHDCFSSKVQVEMLAKSGIISKKDRSQLLSALDDLMKKIESGKWKPSGKHEDIHSAIQAYIEKKAPNAARKLHTGRSRNEQVVNDVRLYCKEKAALVSKAIVRLQKKLVAQADKNIDVIIPGYTHLNRAQPVLFSHLLMSYVEMLERDLGRIKDAAGRADVSVMGSGALAGSALDIDRNFVAKKLGFAKISSNSMDAVSDRDFMVELLSALSIIAVHLSRMSEDMILYSLPEFGFLDMGASYCTGSSLMPQKKNPDVLELIRGKSSIAIGNLNSLLVLMKGLAHTYNRDLQDDKKPLFESIDLVIDELDIMAGLVSTIKLDKEKGLEALEDEFIYATDIAEYLVGSGVSFKDAHDIVGKIVKHCSDSSINISDLSVSELRGFSPKLKEDVWSILNPERSVKGKKTKGSTNPGLVKKQIVSWKKKLK